MVVGWMNPNPDKSGDVVVIVPSNPLPGRGWKTKVPKALEMGDGRRRGIKD